MIVLVVLILVNKFRDAMGYNLSLFLYQKAGKLLSSIEAATYISCYQAANDP